MTALFLACAILLAFTSGIGEKNFMDQFIGGAADLMGVALVVGVARGINIILEDGMISDTILEFFSGAISGMNPIVFIILMMLVFIRSWSDFFHHTNRSDPCIPCDGGCYL